MIGAIENEVKLFLLYSYLFGLFIDIVCLDIFLTCFGYCVRNNHQDFKEFIGMVKERGFYEVNNQE